MDLSVVFQNIDGDGLPTLDGDVVMTCEAPSTKAQLRARLKGMKHYFPKKNYRMTISWFEEKTPLVKKKAFLAHRSSSTPPTPRRDIVLAVLDVEGNDVAFINGHAVNSAWAPKYKPTTFRKQRRALWWMWCRLLTEIVRRQHAKGRIVVLAIDGNRPGEWTIPGMRVLWHHGPDRVMVSEWALRDGTVSFRKGVGIQLGAKTGNGRVTHPSIRINLKFRPRRRPAPVG